MKEYPTDDQLELFIKELERQELYAPSYLKQQILERAFLKETAEALPDSKRKILPVRLFTHRLKIIAGMAAAIIMLILIPFQETGGRSQDSKQQPEEEQEHVMELNGRLNEETRNMNQKMNIWFEETINIFNKDNGGAVNED